MSAHAIGAIVVMFLAAKFWEEIDKARTVLAAIGELDINDPVIRGLVIVGALFVVWAIWQIGRF